MAMAIYWNEEGMVACEAHAPPKGGRVWQDERWRRPSKAVAGALSCDGCNKEHSARQAQTRAGPRRRAAPLRTKAPAPGVVVALCVALSCDLCGGPADRVLIDDPEQLPDCFPPDPIAARLGCGACDDGAWSRVYPVEAADAPAARTRAIARRRAEMRGEEEIPVAVAA